nr:hypothetical protein [Tanacetum cinerariifolium]
MIIESVENGPLIWPTIEENRVTRTNKYAELSATKKIQADCDMMATHIILQGTRANSSGTRGNYSCQQRVVKCFNGQGEGHMERQCPKPKRKRDVTWFRDKVLLVKAHEKGKVMNKEELKFLADPSIAEVKAVLMANLSSYGSDVLSEEKEAKNIDNEIVLEKKVKELDNIVHRMGQYFGKRFVIQQDLSEEQVLRLQTSHTNTDQSASSPVKIEAPRELPKMKAVVQQYYVDKQFFEIQKKQVLIEIN